MIRKYRFVIAVLLALCLAAPALYAGSAEGAVTDAQGFTYESANGSLTITGYTGTETTLAIPADSDGVPVTAIGDYAFYQNASLVSVTIPQGVTAIGEGAFFYCSKLTSVTVPDSLLSIGDGAFYLCSSLAGFDFPSGVTRIGAYAFNQCSALASVFFPAAVAEIGSAAFANCIGIRAFSVDEGNPYYMQSAGVLYDKSMTTLTAYPAGAAETSFTVPDSVTALGDAAFMGSILVSVTLPEGLTSIGVSTFNYNYRLESAKMPESLTEIGAFAFNSCNSLKEAVIPANVAYIGESAFETCSSLAAITVAPKNASYYSLDGVLFETASAMLHTYPAGRLTARYDIPEGTLMIGPSAFYAGSLPAVTIPSGVTQIGAYAFGGCAGFTSVTIPDTVTVLDDRAFSNCTNLASISLPESVTTIGEDVFINDAALTLSGMTGSYAEIYANQNAIAFSSLGEAQEKVQAKDLYSAFAGEQAEDLYGSAFDASMFLARPTLINVWATWCGPCVGEIPSLVKLAGEYAGRINIVGIQLDAVLDDMTRDEDAIAGARKLFEDAGYTYPSLIPTQSLTDLVNEMNVSGIPTTWFVGTDGRLVMEEVGSKDLDGWRTAIDDFLASQGL
jgi:thiol-disulfide isomerase/thioredoxin